jgi:predicted enzyme related to lactoylglutathione lyase
MGIGRLQCHVVDVEDLDVGQAFWSALTGIPPIPSVFPGRYAYLGQADPWRQEVILHLVREPKDPARANRSHVDIWVRDVDVAIDEVAAIGGGLKRPPTIYPRPGSYGDEPARIDWAIATDPFGNEFCLISLLSPEESAAVAAAGAAGPGDDDRWREAAGRARRTHWTSRSGG